LPNDENIVYHVEDINYNFVFRQLTKLSPFPNT